MWIEGRKVKSQKPNLVRKKRFFAFFEIMIKDQLSANGILPVISPCLVYLDALIHVEFNEWSGQSHDYYFMLIFLV